MSRARLTKSVRVSLNITGSCDHVVGTQAVPYGVTDIGGMFYLVVGTSPMFIYGFGLQHFLPPDQRTGVFVSP